MRDETYPELRARMSAMMTRYFTACEPQNSPWPSDPDGGDLRCAGALFRVIGHPRTPPAVLEMLADYLAADAEDPPPSPENPPEAESRF